MAEMEQRRGGLVSRRAIACVAALLLLGGPAGAAREKPAPKPSSLSPANPGFEEELKGWSPERPVGLGHGRVGVTEEGAAEGKRAALLRGTSIQATVGLTCEPVALPEGGAHLLIRLRYRMAGRPESAELHLRPLDDKGQVLLPVEEYPHVRARLPLAEEWSEFSRVCYLPPQAAAYDITFRLHGEGTLAVDAIEGRALRPEEFTVPSQGARIRGANSDAATVWYETSLKKVYRDARTPEAEIDAVEIAAARGESEAFQIVLVPREDADGVRVRWQDLLGPGVLHREHGRAAWVEYVNVTRPRAPLARIGWTPDPLLPDDSRDLRGGQVQPVWLTFTVPKDARPGLYHGVVQVESAVREDYYGYYSRSSLPTIRIPVKLRVRDFALSDEPALTTMARITRCPPEGREAFRENLRAHRVTGEAYAGPLPVRVSPDGSVALEFAPFDEAVEPYLAKGLRLLNFPGTFLGDARGFFEEDHQWHGLELFSPGFNQAFTGYVHQVARHLREKGWLGHTILQLWDEPSRETREIHRRLASLVRAVAPDVRICLATLPDSELLADVDIWNVPLPDGYAEPAIRAFRERGGQLWGYDSRLYSLDVESSSIEMRAYPWRLWRYGFSGAEWWSVSEWLGDPYTELDRCGGQNGGGFLLYPPREGAGAPVNSIRWELYREGVEDYDALALLAQRHAAACERLGVPNGSFDVEPLLARLTGRVARSIADATRNPRDVIAARELTDRLIEMASASPPCVARFKEDRKGVFLEGLTRPHAQVSFGGMKARANAAGRVRFALPDEWRL
jgi:hypothetical protein